jgi:hypothetical protein
MIKIGSNIANSNINYKKIEILIKILGKYFLKI